MGGLKLYCRKHEFYNGIGPACKGNRCDSNLPCSLKVSGGELAAGEAEIVRAKELLTRCGYVVKRREEG